MNSSKPKSRGYSSDLRAKGAEESRARILDSALALFTERGVDGATIAEIAEAAGVAGSTVYAAYKSKEGVLKALMERALFGPGFQSAQKLLEDVSDPVRLIALTPRVARAIYEGESGELGLLRSVSGFSRSLGQVEQEFEDLRFAMQEDRLRRLFEAGRAKRGIAFAEARRILWMYTSRDVYRMLVADGGWTPQRYEDWLTEALLAALVEP